MVDAEAAIRSFLLNDTALVDLVGQRIYAGIDLPEGYEPHISGPAVIFNTRGGSQDYSNAILDPSVQYRCYGADHAEARRVYRALYDAINDKGDAVIQQGRLETQGQLATEKQTGWTYVFCAFRQWVRNYDD